MAMRARNSLPWQREKLRQVDDAVMADPVDIDLLRSHALSPGGLLHAHVRKKAWPKLAGVNVHDIPDYEGPALSSHKDRAQVILDVNRCTKRIPAHYSAASRTELQDKLTRVILRLLAEHNNIHYYQGFHDIVLTFLLVLSEDVTYAVMDVLVTFHIRDYMDADMQRTKMIIRYLRPLLALENRQLEQFLTRSECEYYFTLSWLITWFGHVVHTHEQACRLTDVFLASHPLMPLYLSAAIVLSRQPEILAIDCDMASVHGLLSKIPESINYEQIISHALTLFKNHPPKQLASEGGLKLNSSTLISTYYKFQRRTKRQRPDHILVHLPKRTGWKFPRTLLLRLVVVTGPVILAMVLYWVQKVWRTTAIDL